MTKLTQALSKAVHAAIPSGFIQDNFVSCYVAGGCGGKKAMRWQTFLPFVACFMAFLSFCLCIITLLSFKEKKTIRPRFILTEQVCFFL